MSALAEEFARYNSPCDGCPNTQFCAAMKMCCGNYLRSITSKGQNVHLHITEDKRWWDPRFPLSDERKPHQMGLDIRGLVNGG